MGFSMKITSLGMIGSILWLAGGSSAVAEKPLAPLAAPQQQQEGKAFVSLTEEQRKEFSAHVNEASRLLRMKRIPASLDELSKADALAPGNMNISFNIAEVHFVEHRWEEAMKAFGALQPKLAGGDGTFAALVDLKLLVCHCKLGALGDATALAAKRADDAATPFQWYAKAVIEFENRNRAAAAGFLEDVKMVHPGQSVNAPFMDTLIESRYVKN